MKNKKSQVWVDRKDSLKSFSQPLSSNRIGQVWVETVIYTLIALILIGAVIAFAKPKIEQLQDRAITEKSLNMLNEIDNQIRELTEWGEDNNRLIYIELKKGNLIIDGENDNIAFEMQSKNKYSQEDVRVPIGSSIEVLTTKNGENYLVNLMINYSDYEISYQGDLNGVKTISPSPTAYKIVITNNGTSASGKTQVDLSVE